MRALGATIDVIASTVGLSVGTVHKAVKDIATPSKLSAKDIARIQELRQAKLTHKQISDLMQISIALVKKHCGTVVVPGLGYKGRALPAEINDKIKVMREQGIPLKTIQAQLGVGWSTVTRRADGVETTVRNSGHRLTHDTLHKLYKRVDEGVGDSAIALELDIGIQSAIKFRKAYELFKSGSTPIEIAKQLQVLDSYTRVADLQNSGMHLEQISEALKADAREKTKALAKPKVGYEKEANWFMALAKSRSPEKVAEFFGFTPGWITSQRSNLKK